MLLKEKVRCYLESNNIMHVDVATAKRAMFASARLGIFHFVSYNKTGPNWLIWAAAMREGVKEDLRQWQEVFGEGFLAVIASEHADHQLHFRTLAGEKVKVSLE